MPCLRRANRIQYSYLLISAGQRLFISMQLQLFIVNIIIYFSHQTLEKQEQHTVNLNQPVSYNAHI